MLECHLWGRWRTCSANGRQKGYERTDTREDYEKQGGKPANTILFDESSAQSGINRSKGAQRRGWERPAWQQGEGREGDRPRGMSVTRVRVRTWSRRVRPPCHQQTGVPSGERGSRPWRRLRQWGLSLDA